MEDVLFNDMLDDRIQNLIILHIRTGNTKLSNKPQIHAKFHKSIRVLYKLAWRKHNINNSFIENNQIRKFEYPLYHIP